MAEREKLIRLWFDMWLNQQDMRIDDIFTEDVMSMLTTGILLMSALVAFMSSFLIGYAIRFMLGRRKRIR